MSEKWICCGRHRLKARCLALPASQAACFQPPPVNPEEFSDTLLDTHSLTPAFHQNSVSPNAVHLTDAFSVAYFSKPASLVESDTDHIFGKDARL